MDIDKVLQPPAGYNGREGRVTRPMTQNEINDLLATGTFRIMDKDGNNCPDLAREILSKEVGVVIDTPKQPVDYDIVLEYVNTQIGHLNATIRACPDEETNGRLRQLLNSLLNLKRGLDRDNWSSAII